MYEKLLDAVTAAGASSSIEIQRFVERPFIIAQVDISDTATVSVQGRVAAEFAWVEIHEFISSDAKQVTAFPFMRFNVSSHTAGTVSAALAG